MIDRYSDRQIYMTGGSYERNGETIEGGREVEGEVEAWREGDRGWRTGQV